MPKLTEDEVEFHCKRVGTLYNDRANFDNMWQEIAERT